MINLSIQIKIIFFSFIYGFFFSIFLDFLYQFSYKFKSYLRIIFSFFLVLLMSVIYYIGNDKISCGIFHLYSILCVIFGFVSYDVVIKILANKDKK